METWQAAYSTSVKKVMPAFVLTMAGKCDEVKPALIPACRALAGRKTTAGKGKII